MKLKKIIPSSLQRFLKKVRNGIFTIAYRGADRHCPVCDKSSKKFGNVRNSEESVCMHCGSRDRHRLVWLYFKEKTDIFIKNTIKMLHVAPEPAFERVLKHHLGSGYLTADLYDPKAMVKMDVSNIQYPDESFDVIYCSHVLQYVPDDKQAIREFFRVLKPNGWAILLVPPTKYSDFDYSLITEHQKTYDPERPARRYSADYVERLKEAGFKVSVTYPSDFCSQDVILRVSITRSAGEIYYCTKK